MFGEANLEYSILESDYKWIDSNDQLESNWITLDSPTQVNFSHNDYAPEAINFGFDFHLKDQLYTQCTINPNGWIGLGGDSDAWNNAALPSDDIPGAAIFGFWDDLNPVNTGNSADMSGYVYYQDFGDKFVVFFDQVVHWAGSSGLSGNYTFQMVLHQNGNIDLNYQQMEGTLNSATIGVQFNSEEFLQVSYNSNYTEPNMSTYIIPPASWFSLSSLSGNLEPGSTDVIDITFDTEGLDEGIYFDVMSITTNDYDNSQISIPITLNITDACGQWNLGDVNQDTDFNVQDVIIILSVILGPDGFDECQILSSDLNQDGTINVQDIILLVNTILS